MTETGQLTAALPTHSDEDPDAPSKSIRPSLEEPSRFASKVKLIMCCTMVAKGRHDWAFAQLGKTQGHASSLDLSSESMRTLKAKVQEIWTDYIAEFPPEQVSQELPGATLETNAVSSAEHATEIRATNRIENEHDYQLRLAAWGQACEKAVEEAVDE